MDFQEPEHVNMLRDSVRRFVEREMPREAAARWDRDNHFPRDVFDKLAGIGVMGLTVPEEYGGSGREILACMVVIEELARRSCAVAVPYIMSACYAGMNVVECGSPEQKRELLPRIAKSGLMFAYGITEPDVGADIASVKTTADLQDDVILVNGSKRFCSGAEIADYIYTLAVTDRDGRRHQNLSIVLVPPTAEGVTIKRIDSLGMKGAATTDVTFSDVRIPRSAVVGGPEAINRGWGFIVGPGLDVEKLEVAALGLGIAEAAVDDAWQYAQERHQFGNSISSFQVIRHMLADMRTKLHACRLVLYQASWLADRRLPCRAETSMAKLFICETVKQVVLDCQSVLGAYGYVKEFDMERYVRDILLMPIIGGSSNVQRNNVANALRLPR